MQKAFWMTIRLFSMGEQDFRRGLWSIRILGGAPSSLLVARRPITMLALQRVTRVGTRSNSCCGGGDDRRPKCEVLVSIGRVDMRVFRKQPLRRRTDRWRRNGARVVTSALSQERLRTPIDSESVIVVLLSFPTA